MLPKAGVAKKAKNRSSALKNVNNKISEERKQEIVSEIKTMENTNPKKYKGLVNSISKFKENNARRKTQRERTEMGKNDSDNISSDPIQENMSQFENNNTEQLAKQIAPQFVNNVIDNAKLNTETVKTTANTVTNNAITAAADNIAKQQQIATDKKLAEELAEEEIKNKKTNENALSAASNNKLSSSNVTAPNLRFLSDVTAPNKYFGKSNTNDILVPLIIQERVLKIVSLNGTEYAYTTTNINEYEKIMTLDSLLSHTITGVGTLLSFNDKTDLITYNDNKNNKLIVWALISINYNNILDKEKIPNVKDTLITTEPIKVVPPSTIINQTKKTTENTLKTTARRMLFLNNAKEIVSITPGNITEYNKNLETDPNALLTDEYGHKHNISTLGLSLRQCIINIGALANSIHVKLTAPPTTIRGKFLSFLNNISPNTKYTRDANGFFEQTTNPQARLTNLYLSIYKYISAIDKSIIESNINNLNDEINDKLNKLNKSLENENEINELNDEKDELHRNYVKIFNKNIKEIKGVEFIRTDRVFKSLTGGSKKNRFSKKRKNHTNNL